MSGKEDNFAFAGGVKWHVGLDAQKELAASKQREDEVAEFEAAGERARQEAFHQSLSSRSTSERTNARGSGEASARRTTKSSKPLSTTSPRAP